jgi:hypothetical protein
VAIESLQASSPAAVFAFLDARLARRTRAHWTWKYRLDDPAGARAFYYIGADGTVGGFIGILPTTLHAPNAAVDAAWFVDWATGAGPASVGAGVALLRHAQARTTMLLTLVGSADTRQILPKLRWMSDDRPGLWILRLTARALAASGPVRRRPWLRLPVLAAAPLARLYFHVGDPGASPFRLQEVERFPADYDAVWAERRREFAPLMSRTSAQLNFMCAGFPEGGYTRFLLLEEGRVAGHLILREDPKDGLRRGRIVDALWPRHRTGAVEWLVRRACRRFQERGVDYIECTASAPDLERALRACRFSRRRAVPIWYHRLPSEVPTPETWFVTYLDCDRAYR